ncbi:MAG TPA: F-box protein [Rhabdochlamydiaceae bacterium]|jgi:hypothetical protein|nr:F-box protein [Rhabdochlamydiaceae bacterium]
MKRVAPTPMHVYQTPAFELQCNWLILEIAINILQHLYFTDVASFGLSCKQAYDLIKTEDFWPKFNDTVFSSNEPPEKLNPKRKFKIYSNLIQNQFCQKSIEPEGCESIGCRIVWQDQLVILSKPVGFARLGNPMSRLDRIDLKKLKIMTGRSAKDYYLPCEFIGCQDRVVIASKKGELNITSIRKASASDKSYHHLQIWARLACDPEHGIVAAADEKGTILVWKIEEEPAPSQIFSIPVDKIDDLSVSHDAVVVRARKQIFSLHHSSEKLISKKRVLPDVSHATVYQDLLVTSHNEILSDEDIAPIVKIWDAKTLELKEAINLARLSWSVNPRQDMDSWGCCNWTKPCMEGVFVSQVSRGDETGGFIVIWNLKTKKGSVLEDVDPENDEHDFLIHDGNFITTDYYHANVLKLFDFSDVQEAVK